MQDNFIKLYGAQDINDEELVVDLKEKLSSNKVFYLTATANLRELRKEEGFTDKNNVQLYTFQSFKDHIVNKYVTKVSDSIIKNVEQKIILEQIIKRMYAGDEAKVNTFDSISNELFELFNFILLHDRKEVEEEVLTEIEEEYSFIESSIFKLFNRFVAELEEKKVKEDKITYQKAVKEGIKQFIVKQQFKQVFLDGFLFFDELQKFLIKNLFKMREANGGFIKELIFVSKYDAESEFSTFLFQNLTKLKEEYNLLDQKIEKSCNYSLEYKGSETLKHLKYNYLTVSKRRKQDYDYFFDQNELRVEPPFISRGEEFEFVAKEISNLLQKSDNPERLLERTERETEDQQGGICVVIARNKEEYENKLARFLKEYGLFKFPSANLSEIVEQFGLDNDLASLRNKEYYSRQQFLEDDDFDLSLQKKNKLFDRLQGIELNLSKKPIASYPIGQFLFKIYDIIREGLSIEDFKIILNSNWIAQQCSEYIKDFQRIEVFFEDLEELDEWIEEMDYLLNIYGVIRDNELYQWHPLQSVTIQDLEFLKEVLDYLQKLIFRIDRSEASFQEHISLLRENITDYEKLDDFFDYSIDDERKVVSTIFEVVEDMDRGTAVVDGISTEEPDVGEIAVVNLENMRHYQYTFFITLESDKYPRYYEEQFPFSSEIIKIMKNKFNIEPTTYRGIEEHLALEKYLFKNVIDFTDQRLYLTYVKREGTEEKLPSVYLEDLASMYGMKIEDLYYDCQEKTEEINSEDRDNSEDDLVHVKDKYSTLELGVFNLCNKMYYHLFVNSGEERLSFNNRFRLKFYAEAVLYNFTVDKLVEYSEVNQRIYSIHDDELYFIFRELLDTYQERVFDKFNFLTDFEQKDIRLKVLEKFSNFLNHLLSSSYCKFNNFYLQQGRGSTLQLDDGTEVKSRVDFEVCPIDDNATTLQFSDYYYLYFLVLKTDREKENDDLIQMMGELRWWDRLVDRPQNRERIEEIIAEIRTTSNLQFESNSSKFCKYCLVSNICKEDHLFKEDSDGDQRF